MSPRRLAYFSRIPGVGVESKRLRSRWPSVALLFAALFTHVAWSAAPVAAQEDGESVETEGAAPVAEPATEGEELAAIYAELDALLDALVETRTRVTDVGRRLFSTALRVRLRHRGDLHLQRVRLWVDGVLVHTGGGEHPELHTIFDGFAAPGVHSLRLAVDSPGARLMEEREVRVGADRRAEVSIEVQSELDDEPDAGRARLRLRSDIRTESVPLTEGQ